jgi:hypothetical protein
LVVMSSTPISSKVGWLCAIRIWDLLTRCMSGLDFALLKKTKQEIERRTREEADVVRLERELDAGSCVALPAVPAAR